MDDITLVIGDGKGAAAAVAETLATWVDAGLVDPCLWWSGQDATGHRVRWIGGGDVTEGSMLAVLGSRRFGVIRLVALHLPDDTSSGPHLRAVAEDVESRLMRKLGEGQKVAKLNMVVPASDVTAELDADLLSTFWDTNLLVVDDDRLGPVGYVGDDVTAERLPPHAALAVATAAALWPGQRAAPFDGRQEGGEQEARLRVVRSFARVIRSHGVPEAVTEQVLGRDQDRPWLAETVGAVAAPKPDRVVTDAAREFLAGPGRRLCRTPAPQPRPVVLQQVGPRTAVRWMFSFMADLAREIPRTWAAAALDDAQRRVENFVQHQTFGDGPTTVRVRLAARDTDDDAATAEPQDVATSLLRWVNDRPTAPALGSEWRALRALTFGLVDAGPLPDGCSEPLVGARRQVVTDVGALAADPCGDAVAVGPALRRTETVSVGPAEPVRASALGRALAATEEHDGDGADEHSDRAGLRAWSDQYRGTLLWQVAARLTDDATDAAAALQAALDVVRAGAGSPGGGLPARRRLNRTWLVIGLLMVLGVGTGLVLGVQGALTPARAAVIVALSVLGGSVAAVAVFLPYLRRQFQIAHEYAQRQETYRAALVAAECEARELIRLEAAAAEFDDWATVLGTMLHRPGGTVAGRPEDTVALDTLSAPLALGLARAAADARRSQRLATIVARDQFRRGWLTALYDDVVAEAMSGLKYDDGVDESEPDPDPDFDARARARLRREVGDGTSTDKFGERIRDVVERRLRAMPPAALFTEVTSADGSRIADPHAFLSEICPTPDDAPDESFSLRLWVRRARPATVRDEETVWLTPAVAGRGTGTDDGGEDGAARLLDAAERDRSVLAFRSIRFDATEPALWSDLQLFRPPADAVDPLPVVGDLSHGIG